MFSIYFSTHGTSTSLPSSELRHIILNRAFPRSTQAVRTELRAAGEFQLGDVLREEQSAAMGALFCKAMGTPADVVDPGQMPEWCCDGLPGLLRAVHERRRAGIVTGGLIYSSINRV